MNIFNDPASMDGADLAQISGDELRAVISEYAPYLLPPNLAVKLVVDEVGRATEKFPKWPTDPLHALAILGEEFGELTKEVLQMSYEPHKSDLSAVRTEAIQTAAMALRFVMSLHSYDYSTSEQHEQ